MTCAKQTVIAIIKNGTRFWVGSNHCGNPQEECPRLGMASGEGYELCREVCRQQSHAEVDACLKAGDGAKGADMFIIGHQYCCGPCESVMAEHGVKNVHIVDALLAVVAQVRAFCDSGGGA